MFNNLNTLSNIKFKILGNFRKRVQPPSFCPFLLANLASKGDPFRNLPPITSFQFHQPSRDGSCSVFSRKIQSFMENQRFL